MLAALIGSLVALSSPGMGEVPAHRTFLQVRSPQSSAAQTRAISQVYYGYSGTINTNNGGKTALTASYAMRPLEGYSINWNDSGTDQFGYLKASGSANGYKATMKISGRTDLSAGSDENPFSNFNYTSYLTAVLPNAPKWADVVFTARGTASTNSSTRDSQAGGEVGIGHRSWTKGKAISNAQEGGKLQDSSTRNINISWTYRLPLDQGRSIPPGLPEFLSAGTVHGFKTYSGDNNVGLVTIKLSAFLSAYAKYLGSSATVNLDLDVSVEIRPENFKPEPDKLTLLRATSDDAKSVSLTLALKSSKTSVPVQVRVYKSKTPTLSKNPPSTLLLGSETVTLAPSASQSVTILKGKSIPSDKAYPYVVAVASASGVETQKYFRQWRMAAFVHGFSMPELGGSTYYSDILSASQKMKQKGIFDGVIAFDWREDSRTPKQGLIERNGQKLALQVVAMAGKLVSSHSGDVVRINWYGHSRGTLVVCSALELLANTPLVPLHTYSGSKDVYLIDIHPANPAFDFLRSRSDTPRGRSVDAFVKDFGEKTLDPKPIIPNLPLTGDIIVRYQKTKYSDCKDFPSDIINLHGIGQYDKETVRNNSKKNILWVDKTGSQSHSTIWSKFISGLIAP